MRYLLVLLTTLFASFTCVAAGENVEAQWQKANKLYEQRQYDSAAYYYEQIAARQTGNEYVYFNLGNAYYRLNLVGLAVLNYEKALHVNPANKEAADNLALTQSRINNRIPAIPEIFFVQWWNTLASGSKAGMWALISLFLFFCFIGLLFAQRLNNIKVLPQVLISLVCVNILFLVLAFAAAANKADSGKGVVMQNDAPIYANPAGKGKATNLVPEGTTVEICDKAVGWVEIKLPDGRMGWIDSTLVSKI